MASRNVILLSLMLMASSAFGSSDSNEVRLADDPKSSNAVKMVLKMMEDLDAKVVAEGEQEAKTYNKYSTWCNDTKKEKENDIKDGNAQKKLLEATIQTAEEERDQFTASIEKLNKDIVDLKQKIVDADKARETEAEQYQKTNAETEHAVRATTQAGDAIKASNDKSSFLQMAEQVKTVRESALLAESAGFSSQESLDALSSEQSGLADANDWKTPVLDMLEKMEETFRAEDQKADMEEQKAITSYKMLRQQRLQTIDEKQRSLEQAIDDKAARIKTIANSKEDLATTKDTIADDTKFLAETEQTCLEKKVTFEQRKATREEELTALRLATKTMQDVMTGNFTKATSSLLEVAYRASADPTVLGSAEAEAEAIEDQTGVFNAPFAFFQDIMHRHHYVRVRTHRQQHRHRHLRSQQASPAMAAIQTESHHPRLSKEQQALLQFLNEKAASTKSAKLVQLARRVATGADPFAEVKELIKGLITKLRAEAQQSQTKKMSCDKKISESSVRRDEAAKKVEELNGNMEEAAARKNRLTEEIALLKDQMKKIDLEKNATTKLRNEEKAENKKSVSEAQTGLSGVKQAIQILKDFYSKAQKKEVAKVNASASKTSLLTVEPAPDAGFKNNEANKGSQAASTGIVGMLETIASDFERTVADTQAEEATAAKDHEKFLAEVEASTAAKTKAETIKKGQLDAVTKDLSDDDTALKGQITALKVAVQELKAHEEACGHGATFEERKAARQREMAALKEAIQFFESTR
eukprot:TRINITY_DN10_c0_g1_i2.p1 TRINITY_DN10_c0_g1~~TRINITY_DN10_c0_g1_i2.p1  ORF type:complete len:756 (-),score=242.96 TRINITY_DN10_c0_g1_i2:96-2363(-)